MVDGPISKIFNDPMGALKAFGKGVTEGNKQKITKSQIATYKRVLGTLTPAQQKTEAARLKAAKKVGSNQVIKLITGIAGRYGSAATKTVKKMGGQQQEGALARGGAVKKKMAYGGKAMPKKKMMGGGKVMPKKKMMHGGKVKKK